ncbi:MAG: DUF4097 family beta strand repeat protein [Acidobacteria bacterium]|nr:DUF4097 family beta strand repeat protein [Acidobacteriota bacterium]
MTFARAHILAACASGSLLCTVACVDISAGEARYVDTTEKRFSVTGVPVVDVSTFDGTIDVSTWARPEVLVVVEKHAVDKTAADRILVDASQDGQRIAINVHRNDDRRLHVEFGSFSAHVTLTLPATAHLQAHTGDGRVNIRQLAGDVHVQTGDGAIRLEQVTGPVFAASGDGSIEVDGAPQSVTLRSGDGRVHVRTSAAAAGADWRIATGDGPVVVEVPSSFGAVLDASTGDGRVRVDGLAFEDGGGDATGRRSARGRIGAGGPRLEIRSGDGSITVRRADADQAAELSR